MLNKCEEATIGGLLHDIGKVIYRAGIGSGRHSESGCMWMSEFVDPKRNKDLLDCIKYHHAAELRKAAIAPDSPAYAVYIADNIAAGADRREIQDPEGNERPDEQPFQRTMPLSSIFNLMWGGDKKLAYPPANLDESAKYPGEPVPLTQDIYLQKAAELKGELAKLFSPEIEGEYINSLLTVMEHILSYVPSSTSTRELADISLYDHSKITAAVAAAISSYLEAKGVSSHKKALMDDEKQFMDEKAFIMFSCDFSGIQNFIYTIGSKSALKSLRSRSFFLELLMEYMMDELLQECGMSRANIIYSGGGHCYALLPNTEKTVHSLNRFDTAVNGWLLGQFRSSLYLACSWRECSGNDLRNDPAESSPYSALFRDLSLGIASKKVSRYSPAELTLLNSESFRDDGRECKICGVTDSLDPKEDICFWCDIFAKISNRLLREDVFAVVVGKDIPTQPCLPVPDIFGGGERFIVLPDYKQALKLEEEREALRVYSKNRTYTGFKYSTKIYMGDYSSGALFEELAEKAHGIDRIAVLRADDDDLGKAFISGFDRIGEGLARHEKDVYKSLSRTAGFSRQLSLFFKYHINSLLACKDDGVGYCSLGNGTDRNAGRNVIVVYSGGDDIFLVGSWDDVIEAAIDIRKSFLKFTAGGLTISAGIHVCQPKFPLYMSARLSAALEAKSKKLEGKDGITLFEDSGENTYKWEDFENKVMTKHHLLSSFLDTEDQDRGKAFLYRLLELMRRADDRINIARCAYMLARLAPSNNPRKEEAYREFSKKAFAWIRDPAARRELITAIHIYLYINRKKER